MHSLFWTRVPKSFRGTSTYYSEFVDPKLKAVNRIHTYIDVVHCEIGHTISAFRDHQLDLNQNQSRNGG